MTSKVNLNELLEIYAMELDDVKNLYKKNDESIVLISIDDIAAVENGAKIEDFDEWKEEIILNAIDYINNKDKYIEFPKRTDFDEYSLIEEFIHNCDNKKLEAELNLDINGEDAIRAFKSILYRLELIDEWYEFRDRAFVKFLIKWCNTNDVQYILDMDNLK